ncbi:Zinc protease-like protein [hydrothermal vent metagenome]|uniref:Zinc protease-like protein n=1 Tax=hydrothermal vent metagenome TaxID=652676 RepID=A0A1W1BNT5_9ZZZZ
MKKIIILLILIQGLAMSKEVEKILVKGIEVPIIFEESTYLPIISMRIVFTNSGSLYDSKAGLANLSAKLLDEGTKKDGSVKFATKLENSAISLGVSAGIETMAIELSSLKEQFPKGLKLLKSLLKDPNYTEDTLEHIKKQQIGSLIQKKSDFDYIASLGLKKTLFKDTDMDRPRVGTIDSVKSISIEDIKNHINTYLGINNAIIVVGGDITIDEVKKMVKETLSILPKVKVKEHKFIKVTDKKVTTTFKEDTEQAYIYFGSPFNLKYNDPKQYIAKVAGFILGGSGFGSRLMEEIRVKRGLAYSAYGNFTYSHTSSYFTGYLQTKLENEKEAKELVSEIVDEFVKNGITQKELDATKEFLLGSEPLRNETLNQRVSRSFKEYYNKQPLGYTQTQLKKIEALKLSDINKFIKNHKEIKDISYSIVTSKK